MSTHPGHLCPTPVHCLILAVDPRIRLPSKHFMVSDTEPHIVAFTAAAAAAAADDDDGDDDDKCCSTFSNRGYSIHCCRRGYLSSSIGEDEAVTATTTIMP